MFQTRPDSGSPCPDPGYWIRQDCIGDRRGYDVSLHTLVQRSVRMIPSHMRLQNLTSFDALACGYEIGMPFVIAVKAPPTLDFLGIQMR